MGLKYKVGDKVKIRSLEWYNENKDKDGYVDAGYESFNDDMAFHCGEKAIIQEVLGVGYYIDIDGGMWTWTDEMFEEQLNTITMENKKKFEPFERILVLCIGGYNAKWTCDIFSHIDDGDCVCLGGIYKIGDYDIIPFAGNSHLVGTSDMPEEEVELKRGDLIVTFDNMHDIEKPFEVSINEFKKTSVDSIRFLVKPHEHEFSSYSKYCIPFSKFNPSNMEETKKHILTVKNGKLVRARV